MVAVCDGVCRVKGAGSSMVWSGITGRAEGRGSYGVALGWTCTRVVDGGGVVG